MNQDLLYYISNHSGSLSIEDILINFAAAVLVGGIVYLSYRLSHSGAVYSARFNASLWMLTVVTTMVMCVIGNNVALSLGMVGALSIVRFRTAIKDARDTAYIFWCVAAGICCGISDFTIAVMGSTVLFILMMLLGNSRANDRYLLVVRCMAGESKSEESKAAELLETYYNYRIRLCVRNQSRSGVEYIYELSAKQAETYQREKLADQLFALPDVVEVNLVGQNDEITA